MKFQILSDEEVDMLRAARKTITKIAKRYAKLRKKSEVGDDTHRRLYDELNNLKVDMVFEQFDGDEEYVELSISSDYQSA